MKKALVLALVGTMIFSMPVMAKETGAPEAVYLEDSSYIGITAETVQAINENKTIQEHSNNAVTDHWDMEGDAIQNLAIGQGAVLDGVEAPGLTFNLMKPELKRVYAAKTLAQGKGTLLAVAKVHTHVAYETAEITFYAPGVKAGDAITVYQRVTDDEWTAVPTVVTDDHVAVEITDNTHLAFINTPVAVAAPVAPKAAAPVENVAQEDTEADAEAETVVEKTDADDEESAAETDEDADDEESAAETDEETDAETDEKADAAN